MSACDLFFLPHFTISPHPCFLFSTLCTLYLRAWLLNWSTSSLLCFLGIREDQRRVSELNPECSSASSAHLCFLVVLLHLAKGGLGGDGGEGATKRDELSLTPVTNDANRFWIECTEWFERFRTVKGVFTWMSVLASTRSSERGFSPR